MRCAAMGLLAITVPVVATAQGPAERSPTRALTVGYQHIITSEGERFRGGSSNLVFGESDRWAGVLHASLTRSRPESFQTVTWLFVGGGVRVQGRPRRVVPWAQATVGLVRVADRTDHFGRTRVRHHVGPTTHMGVGVNVAITTRVGFTASAEVRPYALISSVGLRYRWN